MLKQIISDFEKENKVLIDEEIRSEVYSMFDEKEEQQEKIFDFIIKCHDKSVNNPEKFKFFLIKIYLAQTVVIYSIMLLFWTCVYLFKLTESYFTLNEFVKFLLIWSPTVLIGIVITYIYMSNKSLTINKINDSIQFKKKLKKYLLSSLILIALNFIIFNGAPWSLFAVTGASGMFVFDLAKLKYYYYI